MPESENETTVSKVEPAESPLPPLLRIVTYCAVTGASLAIIAAALYYIFVCGC